MKKKFRYSLKELAVRLTKIAAPQTKTIVIGTVSSIVGNVARMGLMGFGAALILHCAGYLGGSVRLWGILLSLM